MRNRQKALNLAAALLAVLVLGVVLWGLGRSARGDRTPGVPVSDGIEQIDLNTVYLEASRVEVNFADVILSHQNETRKLIVSTQTGTVSIQLTDRLIRQLDFDFMKKTQDVTYTGTGYFVVDLDGLTEANVVVDREGRTVTIRIGHAYLQAIEIDPNKIIIDAVKESLLAWGNIKLTMADYNAIEQDLQARLEEEFNTAANGQAADEIAVRMVREVYEPVIQAIDPRYRVVVEFQ